MRFLKMVQCGCRASAQPEDHITLSNHQPVREVAAAGSDDSTLRRKRHRRVGPGKVSSGNWRPSLADIVEDHHADQARKCSSSSEQARTSASAKPTARLRIGIPKSISIRKEYFTFRRMESARSMSAYAPTAHLF